MLKKLFLLFTFCIIFFSCLKAQAQQASPDTQKQQNIEALKIAFLSRQLQLTPDEAQKFWPVYDQYSNEIKQTYKNDPDVIDRDERVLNIRKRYRDEFIKIIGPERTNHMFELESRFHQLLIRRLRHQQHEEQNYLNRPFYRRN